MSQSPVTFMPMPVPKTACRACSQKKWAQSEVSRALLGRGTGTNIAAQSTDTSGEDLSREIGGSRGDPDDDNIHQYR